MALLTAGLGTPGCTSAGAIPWGCPVPVFGNLSTSRVATIGLNPSSREFLDEEGRELPPDLRRLHTLRSLRLSSWAEATDEHFLEIADACTTYFQRNPYQTWFGRLEIILAGIGSSYYGVNSSACHLDLIPFATDPKWAALSKLQRDDLSTIAGGTLGRLLRDSNVKILVLNGRTVVSHFERAAEVRLRCDQMSGWTLPRQSGPGVPGLAFHGQVDRVSGIDLLRRVTVLGYNHNIQSSYGITTRVIRGIRDWIISKAVRTVE